MILLWSLMTTTTWGQLQNSNINPKINSPLSRFGLGNESPSYFAASTGMAGLGAAWQDPYHINLLNPASLASLQTAVFEGGLYAQRSQLTGRSGSDDTWNGNLRYLSLGFSLRNAINRALDRQSDEWSAGMNLALLPYSQVGYDILLINTTTPDVEISSNSLKGSGGVNKLQWGTGFRYKGLSVGADVSFLFGKLINSRLVRFDSLDNALNTEFLDEISMNGTRWNIGAQYAFEFKENNKEGELVKSGKRVIVGGTLGTQAALDMEGSFFTRRYLGSFVSDTISQTSGVVGSGTLPASYSFGVHFQNVNKLNIGVEYGATAWSAYRNTLKPDVLTDAYYVAVGGEYIPNATSYNSYLQRVRYRAGFRYATDPRTLDGEQVTGYTFTLGAGWPIILPRQQVSFVNTAFEFGKYGVDNVLDESFVRFTLGFTLNDNSWFFKRKFN
ncbi:MAG: hypothetical protein R2795_18350 [Saprospiraceae bacterium]